MKKSILATCFVFLTFVLAGVLPGSNKLGFPSLEIEQVLDNSTVLSGSQLLRIPARAKETASVSFQMSRYQVLLAGKPRLLRPSSTLPYSATPLFIFHRSLLI